MNSSSFVMPLSALYGAVVRTRLAAYSRGLLSSSRLKSPVISVGNITVGGTGKTPLVEKICHSLADDGRRVCVLTRGYKRDNPNRRVVVSDGSTIRATAQEAGDEPFLLATNLLGRAAVISDANRVEAGRWAEKELGSNVFVLDDGFQHLQIERDLNILVVDATDPWGGKELLPVGRLREPLSGIKRADCIVITRTEALENPTALATEIRQLAGERPIFTSKMRAANLKSLHSSSAEHLSTSDKVSAFCGVGKPDSFFKLLRRNGFVLSNTRALPDHHAYVQEDIDLIVSEARAAGANALVTTAKDAVKLKSLSFELSCFVQEIELVLDENDRFLTHLQQTFLHWAETWRNEVSTETR